MLKYIPAAIMGSFLLSLVLTKLFIPILHKMKFGQQVRNEGPDSHLKKQGTPTMGGVVILAAFTIGSLFFLGNLIYQVLPIYVLTLGFGIIGFLDDYIKIAKKRSLGLTALQKLVLQFLVTGAFYYLIEKNLYQPAVILVPFLNTTWDLGYLFLPFVFFAVLGTVNGANFTDGLDGLLSSVTLAIIVFFGLAAVMITNIDNGFLIACTVIIMVGVLLGFLMFNIHPAKVFMGDTGSLALGGFVAGIAFMTKMPLFILFVAFIYLLEILSVMLQVTYFKITKGKRIFKMAPIHHHFELCGMEETRVVYLFTVITILLCIICLFAL